MTDAVAEPTVGEISPDSRLFRYSTWIHVGQNAEGCEDVDELKGTNECSNPLHFHAWIRLPNQFQHVEIRERSLAAKARRMRQLRDDSTDAHAMLESQIDTLARQGDQAKDQMVSELMQGDWWIIYLKAAEEVKHGSTIEESEPAESDEDEDDGDETPAEPLYLHIGEDKQRLAILNAMPEDERPGDEYAELSKHIAAYDLLVDERHVELVGPEKARLTEMPINDLLDRYRDHLIEAESGVIFQHEYAAGQWFTCTYVDATEPRRRRFESEALMREQATEVLDALQDAFTDLQTTQHSAANRGNS